jgi:hypothetical protein
VELDTYIGGVIWHGDEREILVVQVDGDLVAGMALLYGSRVIMDVVEDGDVIIDPLP